ncbi:hypothetical protein H8D04_01585 [bacterium]|nr:hypothetical protein [bacterium]
MNDYIRKCKRCNSKILYKTKSQYNDAIKKDRTCKMCSNKNNANKRRIIYDGSLIKKCNNCSCEHEFSNYRRYRNAKDDDVYLCKSCAISKTHTGKKLSKEHIKNISKSVKIGWESGRYENTIRKSSERWTGKNNPMYNSNRTGSLNPFYNKHHSEETITYLSEINKRENLSKNRLQQMSEDATNRVKKLGMPSVNYNPESCKLIENYGKEHGYNFQHAENGGEYKIKVHDTYYFADGYDKEQNVVIEIYENHHRWNKKYDEIRKRKIIESLNCKFIEVWFDEYKDKLNGKKQRRLETLRR